jgi:hypothetical protein
LSLVLTAVLALSMLLPVVELPGSSPKPVPTRVQTLALEGIAMGGGRGMSGVEQPTASRSSVVETEPFGLVGLSWDAAPPLGSLVKVRVREADGWTPWLEIPFHDDHGPDPASTEGKQGRSGTDPMLTGTSDAVQVWVQTPDGQAPPNAEVHLVDTDDVGIQQTSLAEASAAPGMPPIITRAQWGADESMRNRDPIYSDVVKVGFVHHTVSSSTYSADQAAAQVRNLYAWYTEGLKYSDMAYNFLVDRFGRLYEGRYGGMNRPVVGGHTAGLNNDSFAVSAMGNFEEYNPSDEKMDAIKESIAQLMAWKLGLSKRDPGGKDTLLSNGSLGSGYWEAGETATLNRVSGHRDAGNTACPGKFLYAQVGAIRSRAAAIYRNGGTPAPEIPDLITPDPLSDEFHFRGSGSGDGVGVPRAGVLGQARDGRKASAILKHYLTGVEVAPVEDTRTLWVDLARRGQLAVGTQALARQGGAFKVSAGKSGLVGAKGTRVRLRAQGDQVVVERKAGKKWRQQFSATRVSVRWEGTRSAGKLGGAATALRIGDDLLRAGTVRVGVRDGVLQAVALLRVHDEYLPYLQDSVSSWPEQAQRTMAVIARSKALAALWDPECGCHLDDAGFAGQKATAVKGHDAWRKAVNSTATSSTKGLVVAQGGVALDVPVFEASGGATLNASDVWGQDLTWARSVDDPWSLRKRNTAYASWQMQTRPQADVAALFGLPDVVQLDLRARLTGGAVATAVATSSGGQTSSISGERLRTGLQLPSAYIARGATEEPTTATALATALSTGRKGTPVVVAASDTSVVALAAAFAGAQGRPLHVVGGGGPTDAARKALKPAKTLTAVGDFSRASLRALSRLAKVRRVSADSVVALSLELARAGQQSERRTVFVAASNNAAAMASAAMGAVRARGYLLAVRETPSDAAVAWAKTHGTRSVLVAGRKEISNRAAAALRRPVRLGAQDAVLRSARIAGLGSRRGEAILVDQRRVMAAAAAAFTGRAVLLLTGGSGNRAGLRFLQSSPEIADLRSVGIATGVLAAARRA